jgi:hypothetical protein
LLTVFGASSSNSSMVMSPSVVFITASDMGPPVDSGRFVRRLSRAA